MCGSRQDSPPRLAAHQNCQRDSNMKQVPRATVSEALAGRAQAAAFFFVSTLPRVPFCTAKVGKTSDPNGYREASRGEAEW